jgi:voltage-gated potassium channel
LLYHTLFRIIEGITIIIFTIEFFLRAYVSIERKSLRPKGWFFGRLSYLTRFMSIIDLIAILPFYVYLILEFMNIESNSGLFSLLRMLRLFRLIKVKNF